MCAELKPDVVLLDLHMPGDHVEPDYVKSHLLGCAKFVLALCAWDDSQTPALANLYGAKMLLDKAKLSSELIPAIIALAG